MFRVVALCLLSARLAATANQVMRLIEFKGICDGYMDLPIVVHNISIRSDHTRKSLLNGVTVYKKDIPSNSFVESSVKKCKNDSPDTCTNFKAIKFPNLCNMLISKNQLWSTMMNNIEPVLTCPIKKGAYKMKDAYFDLSKSPLPLETYSYWKMNIKFVTGENELLGCFYLEGKILPMKI